MPRDHASLIRQTHEALLGQGDLSRIDEFFAAGYILHAGGKDHKGLAFIRRFVEQLRAAFPNLKVVQLTVLHRAGSIIVWERTLRGTHTGSLRGVPPSGRRVEWRDMVVTRCQRGKIAEDWAVSDLLGQALCKLPAPR